MEKIKIKILKDFEGSTDGIKIQKYKAGEILELGSAKLSLHLFEWFNRNSGFGEIYQEKSVSNAPLNKAITGENLQNKSLPVEEEKPEPEEEKKEIEEQKADEASENKNIESAADEKLEVKEEEKSSEPSMAEKISTKINPFKKRNK